MLFFKKYRAALLVAFTFISGFAIGQDPHPFFLFHKHGFKQVGAQIPVNRRRPKTRIEAGLAFGFYKNDPHYTNSTHAHGGYILGIKEEIPVERHSSIMFGLDFYTEGLTFNSYYFGKGFSVLYDPTKQIYSHAVSINELHIPVEYKFSFTPEDKNIRSFYGMIGYVYRLIVYDNALVTNTQNGKFVYEGQDNLTYKYNLFAPGGSSCMEVGIGYQRNGLKNGNAFFLELNFKYGISPLNYSGIGLNAGYVTFTMNTLSIKVGLKL